MLNQTLPCEVKQAEDIETGCDGIIVVCHDFIASKKVLPSPLVNTIQEAAEIDASLHSSGAVLSVNFPCRRIVYAPTGKISNDFDDVRSFTEAAANGVRRALKAGIKKVLLILPSWETHANCEEATLLGALEALYVPIEVREDVPADASKADLLLVWGQNSGKTREVLRFATAVEEGRFVCRDIGIGDPERMTPFRVVEYVEALFKDTVVKVTVINDIKQIETKYPLFAAVNRAASVIERHRGAVVWLEYRGEGEADKTLLLVGKGVTYDTGGADIKAGGIMVGMSRDKCGAAAIAGFFQTLVRLRPRNIIVRAALGVVRNSVGENGYVSDEIIKSRAGVRVRIVNTDAEGRLVMADLLCEMREEAVKYPNPHLMTIATLTGHAVRTVGHGYSIVLDNAVARQDMHAQKLQKSSEEIGDPFEISTIRREDFSLIKGKSAGVDVEHCSNLPSSQSQRGHQGPAAFLILSSGLDKNGVDSSCPLKFSHMDIAASGGDLPAQPTGAPILALSYHHLIGRF